jgi:hypothetical protein
MPQQMDAVENQERRLGRASEAVRQRCGHPGGPCSYGTGGLEQQADVDARSCERGGEVSEQHPRVVVVLVQRVPRESPAVLAGPRRRDGRLSVSGRCLDDRNAAPPARTESIQDRSARDRPLAQERRGELRLEER